MAKIKDKATTKEARIHNGGKTVSSINGVGTDLIELFVATLATYYFSIQF